MDKGTARELTIKAARELGVSRPWEDGMPDTTVHAQDAISNLALSSFNAGFAAGSAGREWVAVSERLPDTARNLWLTLAGRTVAKGFYHKSGKWCLVDENENGRRIPENMTVIAWQEIVVIPSPEPFTQEAE